MVAGWVENLRPNEGSTMRISVSMLLVAICLAGCNPTGPAPGTPIPVDASAPAARATPDQNTAMPDRNRTAADNTAVNQRDANANAKTPIDQNENQADINTTAKIRQQVLDVKDLSINARNAKIITADGKVTLRGPVNSQEERDTLGRIALAVAGEGNVDNQLDVAAANATPR